MVLTQNKISIVIPSSDTTKESLDNIIGEMTKIDNELKEVKEKMCTSTAFLGESKDDG